MDTKKIWTILFIEDDERYRETILMQLRDNIKNAFFIGVSDIDKALDIFSDESNEKLKSVILSQKEVLKQRDGSSKSYSFYENEEAYIEQNKDKINIGCIILDMCNDANENTGVKFIKEFRSKNKIAQIIAFSGELGKGLLSDDLIDQNKKDDFGVKQSIERVKRKNPTLAAKMALQYYYEVLTVLEKGSFINEQSNNDPGISEPELEMAIWSAYRQYKLLYRLNEANKALREISEQLLSTTD